MLTTDYDITVPWINEEDLTSARLFMEVSEQSFTALWMNRKENKVYRVVRYPNLFPHEPMQVGQLKEIFTSDPMLRKSMPVSGVIYNYSECQLFPSALYTIELNKPLMEIGSGNLKKGLLLSEKVSGRDIHAVYKIPRGIHELFQQSFSAGRYWHIYTLMLMQGTGEALQDTNYFRLIFYPEKLIAGLFKGNQLLFLQTYTFEQPEDISWYLLGLCKQFSLNPNETVLNFSGLIDASSSCYSELEKYFPKMEFDRLEQDLQLSVEKEIFPEHYFSHILKMALCV